MNIEAKIYDELKEIIRVQGEIKAEINEVRVRIEELQKTRKEAESDRDREVEAIWKEIGMLKGFHQKHEAQWNQLRGIKILLWVAIPGMIIIIGKFIIVNFNEIFGIFIK